MTADELMAQRAIEREDDRPHVLISGRYMRDITQDCFELLLSANGTDPRFFVLGDTVVHLVHHEKRPPAIRPLSTVAMKGMLDRLGNFVKLERDVETPARPPNDVVADLLTLQGLQLPALYGVIQAPAYSGSGELVAAPGYQPSTGYFLHLGDGLTIPEIPRDPSLAEVGAARQLLTEELLGDFPFVDDADRAHAVSATILPFIRKMIPGPTPLYFIESPTPGTGKGLLVDVLTIPAAALGPPVMSEGRDEDEWRKRLTAKLLQAPQFVLIDNIRSRLDSAALSAALTTTVWEDRILGQSRTAAVPVTCVWLATANNPALSLEILRRTASIRIDAGTARPWERTDFRHPNLRQWAKENRGELIWAALTLVQAWIAAGKPAGIAILGSYEDWAAVMGGILDVAGLPGFLGNAERVYAQSDRETDAWHEFCLAWWEEYGDSLVGSDLLFRLATRQQLLVEVWGGRTEHGGRTRFGIALAKMRDRVFDGFRINRAAHDSHNKVERYRLAALRGVRGVAGGFSDPDSPSTSQRDAKPALALIPATSSDDSPGPDDRHERGPEKAPQPPARHRADPWEPFLQEVGDEGC